MKQISKLLVVLGVVFIILGFSLPFLSKLGLGHLPGDIIISRGNLRIYIPITTMIIVSILLTLLLWFLNRF